MTRDEIARRVRAVLGNTDDSETAHHEEDRLHQDVLKAIAEGAADPAALAAEALKTLEQYFPHWYA